MCLLKMPHNYVLGILGGGGGGVFPIWDTNIYICKIMIIVVIILL